ncbi:hypothetical protein Q3G72_024386 [Acer saccharum]|nr:hypothetical protein Q3G72_024386 [Acer saccharum]
MASCAQAMTANFDGQIILWLWSAFWVESSWGANYGNILEGIASLEKHNYGMKFKVISLAANRVAQRLARMGVDCVEDNF